MRLTRIRIVRNNNAVIYGRRNDLLRKLGFNSYLAYLESRLWADIRRRVLERDEFKCFSCPARAVQAHHTVYGMETLKGKTLRSLVSVCRACHDWAEFDSKGNKLSPKEATERLRTRRDLWQASLRSQRDVPDDVQRALNRGKLIARASPERARKLRERWRIEDAFRKDDEKESANEIS